MVIINFMTFIMTLKKKYVSRKDIVKCQFCQNEILKQNKIKKYH